MMDFILANTAAFVLIAYTAICLIFLGKPTSYSQSYFVWEDIGERKGKNLAQYWSIWCCLLAFLITIPAYHIADNLFEQITAVTAGMGLIFVGASPNYLIDRYCTWHVIGALASAISAGAYCFSKGLGFGGIFLMSVLLGYGIQGCTSASDKTFWVEAGCFFSYIGIIVYLTTLAL